MSVVINLYGGPGTGKSTSAAWLFALLKNHNINAELVQEYVKQWAWEDRKPVNYDQFYLFGKQSRKEYTLFNKVDVIVTDSPVSLCTYYASVYGTPDQCETFKVMNKTYYKMVEDSGHRYLHIWLNRTKPYNPKGRFQNEQEAKDIDSDMKSFMKEQGIEFIEFNGDETGVASLFEFIKTELV